MPNKYYAKLDGTNLPVTFKYTKPEPVKRHNLLETCGDTKFRMTTDDHIVFAGTRIEWTCVGTIADEYWFRQKYNDNTDPTYTFEGYWGDIFTVKFWEFNSVPINAKVCDMSGVFVIITVGDWGNG